MNLRFFGFRTRFGFDALLIRRIFARLDLGFAGRFRAGNVRTFGQLLLSFLDLGPGFQLTLNQNAQVVELMVVNTLHTEGNFLLNDVAAY
jgi:hypothetical protein